MSEIGRNLDAGPCLGACAYLTCGGSSGPYGCGGCCACLGGCQADYEGKEVRRQYRVSDRRLVQLFARCTPNGCRACACWHPLRSPRDRPHLLVVGVRGVPAPRPRRMEAVGVMDRKRRRLGLLVRFDRYQFSADRCRGQRRPAAMRNGTQGLTVWLPPLMLEFRWGPW